MLAKDTLSSAEVRRTKAEAAEIAMRRAHLRPRPDAQVYEGADIQRILGISEVTGAAPAKKRSRSIGACISCWFMRTLVFAFVAFWLIVAWALAAPALPDTATIIDFIAPTAAQARDSGWVTLSEGL